MPYTIFPLGLLPLVITPAPRVSPSLPGGERFVGQKSGKAALQGVGTTANRVCSITIVTAFAMEAQIASWTHKERLEQLAVGNLINFCCDIKSSAAYWHRSVEPQKSVNKKTFFFFCN